MQDTFLFDSEYPLPYLNSLRQTILADVPGPALEKIQVEANTSLTSTTGLCHMLELLPLQCRKGETLEVSLHVEGHTTREVTSAELVLLHGPADALPLPTPLFVIQPGEQVIVRAQSGWGRPRDHARYQRGHASFRNLPQIQVNLPDLEDVLLSCPKKVFTAEAPEASTRWSVVADRCVMCKLCETAASVSVSNKYRFSIQVNRGQPIDLLHEAVQLMREQVRQLGRTLTPWEPHPVLADTWVHVSELSPVIGQLLVYELGLLPTVVFQSIRQPHPLLPATHLSVRVTHKQEPVAEVAAALIACLLRLQEWISILPR